MSNVRCAHTAISAVAPRNRCACLASRGGTAVTHWRIVGSNGSKARRFCGVHLVGRHCSNMSAMSPGRESAFHHSHHPTTGPFGVPAGGKSVAQHRLGETTRMPFISVPDARVCVEVTLFAFPRTPFSARRSGVFELARGSVPVAVSARSGTCRGGLPVGTHWPPVGRLGGWSVLQHRIPYRGSLWCPGRCCVSGGGLRARKDPVL